MKMMMMIPILLLLIKQLAQLDDIENVSTALDKLSTVLDLAGTWRPVRSLDDRDLIVGSTARWLCFGQTRLAFERYVQFCFCVI